MKTRPHKDSQKKNQRQPIGFECAQRDESPVVSTSHGAPAAIAQPTPLDGKRDTTHAALLRLAQRSHCCGITTEPVLPLCHPEKNLWVFNAAVYKSAKCRGFAGYGDAHPGNVSPLIFNHAEMPMAKTRAVNRAHRTVYGVALCSLEVRPPWPLSPEQLSVLRRTLQYRAPFQKGVLRAAPTNSSRSRRVVSILAGQSRKKSAGNANPQCIPVV